MSSPPTGPAAPGCLSSESLAGDMHSLGVQAGWILLVHASMRRIGRICRGAQGAVTALRDVLGPGGTLVVPTGTADNSDASRLYQSRIAGMTPTEISRYQSAMPPFNPVSTSSTGMGQIAEYVRKGPGAIRSGHPQSSFAAVGPQAGPLMAGHAPDCHLGEASPLGRMYQAGAWILMLGVGYEACSAFHLAEYRYLADPPRRLYRCVIAEGGQARWWEYQDVVLDDSDFGDLGTALEQTGQVTQGRVGGAACRLVAMTSAVDFAVEWFRQHRAKE